MKPEMPIPELGGVVASALAEVLATQFKLPVIASDTPSADQSEQCLIGTVKLTGELLSGDVRLELPEAFVTMITAALHESEVARIADEEIVDMTGELCNMLAGRIAATLAAIGHSSILSVPTVARGRLPEFENAPRAETSWTNWTCEGHLLKVVVQFGFRSR
jgi:CheY-specific phosphatase CheX